MINTTNTSLGSLLSGMNGLPGALRSGTGSPRTNSQATQAGGGADLNPRLTNFDTPGAAALLHGKMTSSVGKALQTGATQPVAQGGDFSPEKVAQNVLSFVDSIVSSARANGANPAAIAQIQANTKAAVEQGFAEAKDILQSFGAWDGAIKDNAQKTLDLIHKGFDDRAAAATTTTPATTPATTPTQTATGVQSTSLAAVATKRAETFEMEIKTREGDVVKLSYSANQAAGFQASQVTGDGSVKQEISAYSSSSQSVSFSVQGNLNADEKKAIADLMKDVDKLAKDFYGGDMQGAMQHAMSLNMNGQQLSSLSLDLSYTQTRSAISAYQQVGALDRSQSSSAPLSNNEAKTVGNFNKDLQAMLQQADKFFQDADKMAKQLFRDLATITGNDTPEGAKKPTLGDMLDSLISAAAKRNEQAKATPVQGSDA